MASLDPAALERELAQLRRQRFEASQRVRASRQPVAGPGSQIRGLDLAGSRPGERRFGTGPPSARGEGPRGPPFRDGPLAGRLGPGPASRGGPDVGPSRGGRFDGPGRDGDRFGDRFGGPPARGPREPYGRDRDADRERDRDGRDAKAVAAVPARRRALLSSVVVGNGAAGAPQDGEEDREGEERGREDADGEVRHGDRDRDRDHEDASAAHEDGGADRKAAAGGRWGPAMGAGAEEEEAGGRGVKRPAAGGPGGAAEDPDSRKRARRLLGRALLGTLQKFRQEDAQFQKSETAARRAELARKAEEKAAAESERLRRAAADDRARKRQEELDELLDLNLATDIKALELMYAKKLARHRAMAGFLRAGVVAAGPGPAAVEAQGAAAGKAAGKAPQTADEEEEEGAAGLAADPAADKMDVDGGDTAPAPAKEGKGAAGTRRPSAVYWRPARHNNATLALKERQQQQLKEWEAAVLLELETEKAGLRQRAEARRASLVERRQQRAAAAHEGRDGGAAGAGAEEEAEDHEVLNAVELDMQHEEGEAEPGPEEPQAPSQAAAAAGAGPAAAAAAAGEAAKAGGSGKAADRSRGHRDSGEHEEEGEHTVAMAEAEAAAAAAEAEAAMKEEEAVAAAEMLDAGDEE